jgi:hypothetical protein
VIEMPGTPAYLFYSEEYPLKKSFTSIYHILYYHILYKVEFDKPNLIVYIYYKPGKTDVKRRQGITKQHFLWKVH